MFAGIAALLFETVYLKAYVGRSKIVNNQLNFTCGCVFKEITLVGTNQSNYFENATACSKRTLKTTTVETQLYDTSV